MYIAFLAYCSLPWIDVTFLNTFSLQADDVGERLLRSAVRLTGSEITAVQRFSVIIILLLLLSVIVMPISRHVTPQTMHLDLVSFIFVCFCFYPQLYASGKVFWWEKINKKSTDFYVGASFVWCFSSRETVAVFLFYRQLFMHYAHAVEWPPFKRILMKLKEARGLLRHRGIARSRVTIFSSPREAHLSGVECELWAFYFRTQHGLFVR